MLLQRRGFLAGFIVFLTFGTVEVPAVVVSDSDYYADSYEENLKIKALPTGNIYTYFEFSISDFNLSNHTRYFPRALSDILIYHSVQELHFSLTQGYWRTESWGDPILPAPGGAQVVAWFTSKDNELVFWS